MPTARIVWCSIMFCRSMVGVFIHPEASLTEGHERPEIVLAGCPNSHPGAIVGTCA